MPGRLYSAGKVYASSSTAWSKDFITQLPVAGKKIAAVVTWGSEADTDVRPRQFLSTQRPARLSRRLCRWFTPASRT